MKITFLILFFVTCGCATVAPYSYKEQCAFKGMVLSGVDSSTANTSGSGFAYANGRVIPVSTSGVTNNEIVRCEIPKTKEEICEASRALRNAKPKIDYNDNITTKRWITGLGYAAFVAPGVTAKLIYDHKYNQAMEQSGELYNSAVSCEQISKEREMAADKWLDDEIQSVRKEYSSDIDFGNPKSKESLEIKILHYGIKNNIPSFRGAFDKYCADTLRAIANGSGKKIYTACE